MTDKDLCRTLEAIYTCLKHLGELHIKILNDVERADFIFSLSAIKTDIEKLGGSVGQ